MKVSKKYSVFVPVGEPNLIETSILGGKKLDWIMRCWSCFEKNGKGIVVIERMGKDGKRYYECPQCKRWSGPWIQAELSEWYGM